MKITRAELYTLIKECYAEWYVENITEGDGGAISNFGGAVSNLGALRAPSEPPLESQADSIVQNKALSTLVQLGLDEKVAQVIVDNVAVSDLTIVLEKIPKIDTAAEGEDELYEEYEDT